MIGNLANASAFVERWRLVVLIGEAGVRDQKVPAKMGISYFTIITRYIKKHGTFVRTTTVLDSDLFNGSSMCRGLSLPEESLYAYPSHVVYIFGKNTKSMKTLNAVYFVIMVYML